MSKKEADHHHEPLKTKYVGVTVEVGEPTEKQRKKARAALEPLRRQVTSPHVEEIYGLQDLIGEELQPVKRKIGSAKPGVETALRVIKAEGFPVPSYEMPSKVERKSGVIRVIKTRM